MTPSYSSMADIERRSLHRPQFGQFDVTVPGAAYEAAVAPRHGDQTPRPGGPLLP